MTRKLVLASAGAGKSQLIVKRALDRVEVREKILILTYTRNNQEEIVKKFCDLGGFVPSAVTIKGWFTFLLEDMIRPYQSCIFHDRIPSINFNSVDPHKRNGRYIPGRSEKICANYNSKHFLTSKEGKAHTTYISKLAVRINSASGGKSVSRLSGIYQAICIDEVQDLTGWDFEILKSISVSDVGQFYCVGDFRQTLYSTHPTTKKPKENNEKLARFKDFGLESEPLNVSWRCIQKVCDFADLVHRNEGVYEPTESKLEEIDPEYEDHLGIFIVKQDRVSAYIEKYKPVLLRANRNSQKDLCEGREAYNFGEAKGMGFDRVLICATEKHKRFLANEENVFDEDISARAKNSLYVAITRARYSVAFIYNGDVKVEGAELWLDHAE
ncbi:UvrD-helicase domain-containing protein [Aurantivibrio infirmus]